VQYAAVAQLKLQALQALWAEFRARRGSPDWQPFDAFRRELGEPLELDCLFTALREFFAAQDPALADWHAWPQPYRDRGSAEVARFADEHRDRIEFHVWLQWIADRQLADAAQAARSMAIGLYRDLAVGADRSGAETWVDPVAVVSGAHVGAPPDVYNQAGQDWGLPPFDPHALRNEGYRSFIELVRANMRHAGGLRIDHVMALEHLYWVPQGEKPTAGAYVRYPLEDLVGILALESHRHRCLVVGEDLGTVPEGFRERMQRANILSYRVLFFENDGGRFFAPDDYPPLALAVAGSHDLPTLRAWWLGSDIDLRERLGLFPNPDAVAEARAQRDRERERLLDALRAQGLLRNDSPSLEQFVDAAHAYLAATRSFLAVPQLDDVTGETEPVNVPATSTEHPNWRRRLSVTVDALATDPRLQTAAAIFGAQRGRRDR
ncbi:MAG TPA: 4-alpha-glucanotransferase, partial [Burkholderiaceae bacterium]|nr:4-alpha-glucanotransferase [Burkholderiaceae bacterium]